MAIWETLGGHKVQYLGPNSIDCVSWFLSDDNDEPILDTMEDESEATNVTAPNKKKDKKKKEKRGDDDDDM